MEKQNQKRPNYWLKAIQLVLLIYLFLVSIETLKAGFQMMGGSPDLHVADLSDPVSLGLKIREAHDPVAKYIRESLSDTTKEMVDSFDPGAKMAPAMCKALLNDLNLLLSDASFYNPQRFANVKISDEDLKKTAQDLESLDLKTLNRELLRAAFPAEIAKMRKGMAASIIRPREGHGWKSRALVALIGLCMGLLATSLAQSSSSTTSILVGMVAANTLTLEQAIPMVMGANIGTSVTNLLVATAHITRRNEFKRAFAAATVHDAFNLMAVTILLPLEIATGYLQKASSAIANMLKNVGGLELLDPVANSVKPVAKELKHLAQWIFPSAESPAAAVLCLAMALVILFMTLKFLVDTLKAVMVGPMQRLIHGHLFKTTLRALLFGTVLTAAVQSSSITTSLMVPLVAGGIVTLHQVFPYTVGANIGTTITALLAALVTQRPEAIALALAHTLFNITAAAIFLPLRALPIRLAELLSTAVAKFRPLALIFIALVFFVFPLTIILVFR